jgi:hypothetical protein
MLLKFAFRACRVHFSTSRLTWLAYSLFDRCHNLLGVDRKAAPKQLSQFAVVGQAYICIVVDYFTKAAEFLFMPDKTAISVATVFHDVWLMRYGIPEWSQVIMVENFKGLSPSA